MPRNLYRLYFPVFPCFLLFASNALAIVNIEDIRVQEGVEGFSGKLAVDANQQSGNTNSARFGVGSRLQWHRGNKTDFVVLNHDFGESGGMRDVNKSFLHGRHIWHKDQHWSWEGFGQLEQNEFTRLSFRALAGTGLRRTLVEDVDKTAMYLGLGGFYSTERLDDDSTTSLVRANLYFVVKHAFNKNTRFISTSYYQPAVNALGDFRALEQLVLSVAINSKLDLKLSLDIAHDSQPPTGVKSTDSSYRTGLEYRF